MDLNAVRERINAIDDQIVDLFVERMKASADVASAKAEKNLPVLDLRREQAVLEKVMERGGEEFEIYINKLYQTIFDISKSYQAGLLTKETALSEEILKNIADPHMEFPRKAVVACQGVEGSYAARACDRLFALPSKMYFSNFESVFNAVESGLCRYGVLPIENSSAGSVTEVYDLMVRHKFYIVKSIKLHISHALPGKARREAGGCEGGCFSYTGTAAVQQFPEGEPQYQGDEFLKTRQPQQNMLRKAAEQTLRRFPPRTARSCMDCMFCRMACKITKTTIPDLSALQRTWKFMQAPTVSA